MYTIIVVLLTRYAYTYHIGHCSMSDWLRSSWTIAVNIYVNVIIHIRSIGYYPGSQSGLYCMI